MGGAWSKYSGNRSDRNKQAAVSTSAVHARLELHSFGNGRLCMTGLSTLCHAGPSCDSFSGEP